MDSGSAGCRYLDRKPWASFPFPRVPRRARIRFAIRAHPSETYDSPRSSGKRGTEKKITHMPAGRRAPRFSRTSQHDRLITRSRVLAFGGRVHLLHVVRPISADDALMESSAT